MTPEKQDKTLELSKHWSVDSTPARNEVIMKRTYPVKYNENMNSSHSDAITLTKSNVCMASSKSKLCKLRAIGESVNKYQTEAKGIFIGQLVEGNHVAWFTAPLQLV